jgi:hypothetical protein
MVVENGGPTREAHSICGTGGKQLDDCMSLLLSVLCQNVHLLQVSYWYSELEISGWKPVCQASTSRASRVQKLADWAKG